MNRTRSFLAAIAMALTTLVQGLDRAAGQEIALTPMESREVAKGYRAEALKLKSVINDKGEMIGRISDFIFGKDGNIYAVLEVSDLVGPGGHLVAIPFHSLKLNDPRGEIVLPGASQAALGKLPVYLSSP
ncbi:PRC-barrel domain-containing protein [Bradyrhizobium sp. CCGUVB14]|uniref:PRC-barrel domain-containing protein n=1 Tax=Bradyrhizobium sp. CCGUVB14 TaxID=2949628 RepID=UPI0020B36A3B|nr:PRC-barrel domain-containing protein [Bradyrhizobium sp. CCGUVB14]MCP3440613.1 PRC-barrel domain-containing protein [Bradyrhizobium sp. CCGUVB14]